jgi:hypothetical protein
VIKFKFLFEKDRYWITDNTGFKHKLWACVSVDTEMETGAKVFAVYFLWFGFLLLLKEVNNDYL